LLNCYEDDRALARPLRGHASNCPRRFPNGAGGRTFRNFTPTCRRIARITRAFSRGSDSTGDSRRLYALWKWRHLARHIAAARNPSPREVVSFRRDALANYAGPTPTQIVVGLPSEPLLGFAVTARLFWAVLKASATPVPHRLAPSE